MGFNTSEFGAWKALIRVFDIVIICNTDLDTDVRISPNTIRTAIACGNHDTYISRNLTVMEVFRLSWSHHGPS